MSRDANRKLVSMQHILEALGKRMRQLRAKQGFSQEAFADHCGLHRVAIGLIEQGKRVPSLRTLVIIAFGFKVSVAELVEGVDKGLKHPPKPKPRGRL